MKSSGILFLLIFLSFEPVSAFVKTPFKNRIDKGFEALQVYNYFEAKRLFTKTVSNYPCISNYALSLIYYRNDNPFHQYDSAYMRILVANESFESSGKNETAKLAKYQITATVLKQHQELIENKAFHLVISQNGLSAVQNYINLYKTSVHLPVAIRFRDSLAFEIVKGNNSSEGYKEYISNFPQSHLSPESRVRYERALYREHTNDGKIESYIAFLDSFPNSPHSRDAQEAIYKLYTGSSTDPDDYYNFVLSFPDNEFTVDAWQNVYDLFMIDKNETAIPVFRKKYPGYPYADQLEIEYSLSKETFLPYRDSGFWGFIDTSGKVVIKAEYDFVEPFSDGLAVVSKSGKMGYVNKAGVELIPPFFDEAEDFQNNLAIVSEGGQFGVINRSGKMVVPLSFQEIADFSEGLAAAYDGKYWGYIDRSGETVIPFRYDDCSGFLNGCAVCELDGLLGVIDLTGNVVIPFHYEDAVHFDENHFKLRKDSKTGLISSDGSVVVNFEYDEIGPFYNNRALVIKDDKYGYINKSGDEVIPVKYTVFTGVITHSDFSNGYAAVKMFKKFGLIDTSGILVSGQNFDEVNFIGESMYGVKKNNKWGYSKIDNPKAAIKFTYDHITNFRNDKAIVRSGKNTGVINSKGAIVIPFDYENLTWLSDELLISYSNGKLGVIDTDNEVLVDPVYDEFSFLGENFLQVSSANGYAWFDLRSKKIIFSKQLQHTLPADKLN
jgi:hypothetical protein